MANRKLFIGLVFCSILYSTHQSFFRNKIKEYFKKRKALIRESESKAIGANLTLTKEEQKVNHILMTWKNQEFEIGFKDPKQFWAGQHFFRAKPHIEESKVFKFIQKLPKGASLHSHDTALVSDEYVFNNITFRDNLYAKDNEGQQIDLKFFKHNPGLPWMPISECREQINNFNHRLRRQMTLVRKNPEVFYADLNQIWTVFQNLFKTIEPLLTYQPVFKDYFYQALKELYEDNVRYLEFRGILPQLYDLEGSIYGPEDVVQVYYETSRKFMKDFPEFWGVKFIFAPHRFTNAMDEYVDLISKMVQQFPNFLAGFDLVGQEDSGPPLKDLIPSLLRIRQVTRLFLHAGETLWNGLETDENLIDVVLLNATRIGHGYAILKHPEVLKIVKERNIALEICPISNQVLGLVKDLRNHPANYLIANNYPVVIAPDDPSFWGARGLSYDWYLAFMGMSSRHTDLRLLKQLALNSITYSSMEEELKEKVLKKWEIDWKQFIENIIFEFY